MAFQGFKNSGRPTIEAALDDLPERAKPILIPGLKELARMVPSKWDALVPMALEAAVSAYPFRSDEFERELGLKQDEAHYLGNAATFIVTLVGSYEECSPDQLISELRARDMVSSDDAPGLLAFVEFVASQRANLEEDSERNQLESEVLPTLQRFQTAVDLRFEERADGSPRIAPVLVTMIDTDAEGQLVWFQMTKRQVQSLATELQEALEKMNRAEAWASSRGGR